MQGLQSLVRRLLAIPAIALLVHVLDVYGRAAGGLLANGLAFTSLFAVVPTVLLMLGSAGLLLGDPRAQVAIVEALTEAFPPLEPLFAELLAAVVEGSTVTSVLGLGGLVWAVSQFYVALDLAFARIFVGEPERDPLRRTLRGFVWVAAIVAVVVATVVAASVASFLDALLPGTIVAVDTLTDVLTSPITALVLAIVLLAAAYRVLPPIAPPWRAVIAPAMVAGSAVVVLTQLFTIIAPRLVGVAAVAGSLAAAFVALAWLSFSFQAILLGAAWVAVRAGRPLPAKASEPSDVPASS